MDIQSFQTVSAEFVKKYKRLLLWKEYAQALDSFVWSSWLEAKMRDADCYCEYLEQRDELGQYDPGGIALCDEDTERMAREQEDIRRQIEEGQAAYAAAHGY